MSRILQYLLTGTYTDRTPIAQSRSEEFAHLVWLTAVFVLGIVACLMAVAYARGVGA